MKHPSPDNSTSVDPTSYVSRPKWASRLMAMFLLFPAGPVIGLLGLLVRATSRGKAFYTQERSGLGGKPFQIYKIRTMCYDAEAPGQAVWSTKGDPRVTAIGRALRFLHLDELPQLVNIARGEMAFIGPRPERPQIVEDLADTLPGYVHRLQILPGVTGLAQINLPPDESIECVRKKLILDCLYIGTASRGFDFRILVCTVLRMIGIRHGLAAKLMRVRFRFDHEGRLLHGDQPMESIWSLEPEVVAPAQRQRSSRVLSSVAVSGGDVYTVAGDDSPSANHARPVESISAMVGRQPSAGVAIRPK